MSRYDLVNATEKDLDAFYDGSALTFEGCTTDKDNLDYLYNWLKDLGAIKGNNLPIYTYKGSMMNEKYGLTMTKGYNGESKSFEELGITQINVAQTNETTLNKNFDGKHNDLMTQNGATFVVNGQTHEYADLWNASSGRIIS